MDIRDRVAVVTGGANGLGQAMCTRLAQSGVHVCVADIDSTSGHQLAQQLARAHGVRAIFVRCDVTKPQDLASALQAAQRAFGKPVSIMVNNAGIGENTHVPWTESHSAWKPVVDVNLSGVIEGTRVAVQHMVEAGVPDGVVLNMSSLAGLVPTGFSPVYSATKWGVVGFTRSLKLLQALHNVRVCALCPAFARTQLVLGAAAISDEFKELLQLTQEGKLLEPEAVADAVLQLVTDAGNGGKVMQITLHGAKYVRFPQLDLPQPSGMSSKL